MADDNTNDPLLNLLAMGSSQAQPAPASVPPPPDVSSLPASTTGAPQPLQAPQQQPQQQYQGGGTPRPILLDLIQGLIKPRMLPPQIDSTGVQGPPQFVSRAQTFENFLGNFVQALGAGFQNEGRGPGAGLRGAGAAIAAPYLAQQERAQFGTEQAQRQAQTQMTQEQAAAFPAQRAAQLAAMTAQPRFDPDTKQFIGNMTDAAFTQYVKGAGAAATTARSKQAIAELNQLASQDKVAFIKPAVGGGFAAYDKQGNLMRVLEGAIDPAQLQKVSSTTEWKSDGAGGFMALPKTTVSGPAQSQLQSKVPALSAPGAQPPSSGFPKTAGTTPNAPSRTYYGKGPVFAFDPQSGQQVLSDPAEVAKRGYTNPVPVKQGDIEREKSVTAQISDVQVNKSRYAEAAANYAKVPLQRRAEDEPLLNDLLNKAGIADFNVAIAKGGKVDLPIVSPFLEGLSRESKTASYINLSDEGKNLFDGYLRTMSAVPAYQKALSNIGRSNKEMLDLELANIPSPTLDAPNISRKLQAFQENIDQVGARTVRMPGIPTVQEVRAKYEPSSRPTFNTPKFQIPEPFKR